MSSFGSVEGKLSGNGPASRLTQWLDAVPHPHLVCEISTSHVAAAQWGRGVLDLEAHGVEELPPGAIVPSAVEANIKNSEAVRAALRRVASRIATRGEKITLLVPDSVVRVFILPFETFPRRAEEAVPLLRWRLKKSVPFDVEGTVVSWMRQTGRAGNLEILAALARQEILREYEAVVESAGMETGVVLSSTLATLPLLEEQGSTLLARLTDTSLTTAIVVGGTICVYRTNDVSVTADEFAPQSLLDEIFPAVAYFQDTWGGGVDRVRLAGFGGRTVEFRQAVQNELGCAVMPLASGAVGSEIPNEVVSLGHQRLEGLVGWALNRGA
ncbi:MAG: type IV pilus biogenesis protein PilM [Candidatus Acidiferrales bacterium]